MKHKKAMSSIGTLILFISLLFVATITVSVLIQNANVFQSKSLSVGQQAQKDVSSGFRIVDITAYDGQQGELNYFIATVKVHAGASASRIEDTNLLFGTTDLTAQLNFRGVDGTVDNSNQGFNTFLPEDIDRSVGNYYDHVTEVVGFITPVTLQLDFDYDGINDSLVVCRSTFGHCPAYMSGTHIKVILSSGPEYFIELQNTLGGTLSLIVKNDEHFDHYLTPIGEYGFITITGSENGAGGYLIPANRVHVFTKPYELREDLDDDGLDDSFVINNTHIILLLSSYGDVFEQLNQTSGVAVDLGVNLKGTTVSFDELSINLLDSDSGQSYGTVFLDGTTVFPSVIDDAVSFIVTPQRYLRGYFSVQYVQMSDRHVPGILQQGETARIFFEAPRGIREDESVKVSFIHKHGTPSFAEFYMPNIISREFHRLYP